MIVFQNSKLKKNSFGKFFNFAFTLYNSDLFDLDNIKDGIST